MENELQTLPVAEPTKTMEVFSNVEDLAANMDAEVLETTTPDPAPAPAPTPDVNDVVPPVIPVTGEPLVEEPPVNDLTFTPQKNTSEESVNIGGTNNEQQYSETDIETAVFDFLSEKLGRDVTSMDDISQPTEQENPLDERVQAIANFVNETGRPPQEWFTYQALNTSEMDDLTAVKVSIATKHPSLTQTEIELLVNNKYNLNTEDFSEEEVSVSKLQMKMDASSARAEIETIREQYSAPIPTPVEQEPQQSLVDDTWVSEMSSELDSLTGLEFSLANGKNFTFSLDDTYKSELKEKNANLDSYFDSYINTDGSWDFDKLNSHRAIVDNIDSLTSSIYRQGLSDGQRGIVENAANVSSNPSQRSLETNPQTNLAEQVRSILRSNSTKTTFNI